MKCGTARCPRVRVHRGQRSILVDKHQPTARSTSSSVLNEGHCVPDVFLLLFKRFLFLRRVLRLLLALLGRLMGHGSLLCVAETAASRQYRPKSGAAQGSAGASPVTSADCRMPVAPFALR